MYELVIYDTSNYEDFPIGGQLKCSEFFNIYCRISKGLLFKNFVGWFDNFGHKFGKEKDS